MRTATSLWAHLDAVGDEFVNASYDSTKDEVCSSLMIFIDLSTRLIKDTIDRFQEVFLKAS